MKHYHDIGQADLLVEANEEGTSYERLCEIFNEMYDPALRLDPAHPICVIMPAADRLAHAGFIKGAAFEPASVRYPSEQAQLDLEFAHRSIRFLKNLINQSVNRVLSGSLKDAQNFSALTLKAALAGAFTPPGEKK